MWSSLYNFKFYQKKSLQCVTNHNVEFTWQKTSIYEPIGEKLKAPWKSNENICWSHRSFLIFYTSLYDHTKFTSPVYLSPANRSFHLWTGFSWSFETVPFRSILAYSFHRYKKLHIQVVFRESKICIKNSMWVYFEKWVKS